ncbi:MAG: hypothetical protein KC912_12180 [Proteobacteria bacterium]|nr:hypothetical protein [Pseudomonadota bacterium]
MPTAELSVMAAHAALEMHRWDDAVSLVAQVDHAELAEAVARIRAAASQGRAAPATTGLDALRERIVSASDEERGPLEALLGLRLAVDGDDNAYAHLEQAVMYLSYDHAVYDLVMEVAEALEDGGALSESLSNRVRDAVTPKPQRLDRAEWTRMVSRLMGHIFAPRERERAWRRAGRGSSGPWRTLEEIVDPRPDEFAALDVLLKRLSSGR